MFRAKSLSWFVPALFFAAIAHAQDSTAPRAYKVEPEYTEEARRAGIESTVELAIVVDKDGSVRDPRVSRSVDAGLDAKAIQAVKQWAFTPGQKNGVPVRSVRRWHCKTPELTARSLLATRPMSAEIMQEEQKKIGDWIEVMKKKYAVQ